MVGICTKVHLRAPVKNIKEIWLVMKAVDLGSISVNFLSSYLRSDNRSLENFWTISDMRNFITKNFSKKWKYYVVFALPVLQLKDFSKLPFCKGFSKSEKPYYNVNKTLIYNTLKNITLFYMKFSGPFQMLHPLNTSINS